MRTGQCLLAAMLALAVPGNSSPSVAPTAAQSTIVNSVGFVRGRIGTNLYWFLVDTGANRSALDGRIARDLGVMTGGSSKVEGSAGEVSVEEALIPRLQIGTVTV